MSTVIETYGLEKLSTAEKIELMHELWESISAEVESFPLSEAQKREIDRRLAAHEADPTSAIPWEQVKRDTLERWLWESISAEAEAIPLTEAQKQEIDRRWAAFEANPESAIPWEQIEQEALNRFKK
jgi:putative addiction module component (TIGR02574 family)